MIIYLSVYIHIYIHIYIYIQVPFEYGSEIEVKRKSKI